MTIPTFNNGDSMGEVRTKSLNPLISKANALETLVQDLQNGQQILESNINQKLNGLHVEDIDNNAFDDITALHFVGATVSDDGSQQATITVSPEFDLMNGQEEDSTSVKVKSLEFPDATITTRNNGEIGIVDIKVPAQEGIILDNGTDSIGNITTIEVPTSELLAKGSGVVELRPYVTLKQLDGTTLLANTIEPLPPLRDVRDSNDQYAATLEIDPRAYESQHAASCLLELDSDVTLQNGKATRLYTSHEIVPTGEYFSLNKQARGVDIQDNTGGDTAVTGGELTRIMASVGFYGKATDAGNVKVWLWYKDPASPLAGGILKDVNGNPMVAERFYNVGDDLETPLIITGAMMATGNAPIVLYVETSAGSYVVDPKQTLLCVEQFSDGFETSLASIEFQRRLGVAIDAEIRPFTQEMLSLKEELLGVDESLAVIPPHTGYDFLNEFGVQNLTEVMASISNDALNIQDNGKIADFYVDVFLDNTKTRMLRGKDIDVEITMKNPRDGFVLEAYKWTGKADAAGRIYDSRNNMSPVLNTGFALIHSKAISEQVDGQYHGYVDTFTVPEDANNIFIIVRPVEAQSPIDMSIKDFTWGVAVPFKGYAEISRINLNEMHFKFDKKYAEFLLNNQGYASLRYTINNVAEGNPMPIGKLGKGKAPVVVDNTVNQVSGSGDPQNDGAIKFLKDGQASISKSYNVWNEQGTDNTVTFWDILIDVDGNETKIPESEKTFTIPANTGAPGVVYSIPAYVVEVETGQRIGGRAKSNKADGAYVQSVNPSEYIVQTIVEFDELKVAP